MEIPKRGSKHYKQNWDEEDGNDPEPEGGHQLPTSEARGGIEMMNDDVAESDEVSAGPTTARVLSLLRPLTRPVQEGDASGGALSMEMEIDGPEPSSGEPKPETQAPASAFPESTWKNTTHAPRQDYSAMDDRLLQELRYIGFLSPTDQPNYADIADDEVTARLRYLQRELRQTILTNGARKARVLEVASD